MNTGFRKSELAEEHQCSSFNFLLDIALILIRQAACNFLERFVHNMHE